MAKYRALTLKELHNFEKEFIDYLIVNGITAEEWERLKVEEAAKAEQIVSLFSDVIFEGVLRNIEFLEFRSPKQRLIFKCEADKMILRGLRAHADSSIDLLMQADLEALKKYVEVIHSEKPYTVPREMELFQMLEKGCSITDDELYNQLGDDR
ncbi:MAG: hypothetical protein KTR13_06480 [Saprospiraceae bacterium]|nr:hypothetical protein [Saprospiraceae bacterium]